jgi:hypothetical protein
MIPSFGEATVSDGRIAPFGSVRFRPAGANDAEQIALLHADSWRRRYRGAYADSFLDGDIAADRRSVWSARLAASANSETVLAGRRSGPAQRHSPQVAHGVAGRNKGRAASAIRQI